MNMSDPIVCYSCKAMKLEDYSLIFYSITIPGKDRVWLCKECDDKKSEVKTPYKAFKQICKEI